MVFIIIVFKLCGKGHLSSRMLPYPFNKTNIVEKRYDLPARFLLSCIDFIGLSISSSKKPTTQIKLCMR